MLTISETTKTLLLSNVKVIAYFTKLERNTIQQYKSVADKTSCTRVQDLDYAHHREVAKPN